MKAGIFFGLNLVDENAYGGWAGQLSGCVPDARGMATAFASMGYDTQCVFSGVNVDGENHIPWVATGDTTKARWIEEHRIFQEQAEAGDWIIFGYSGHGNSQPGPLGFGKVESLCFYDGQLSDVEQHRLYCGWKSGVNVVYFFDSCFSGGMDRAVGRVRPKALPPWAQAACKAIEAGQKSGDILANVVLMEASAKDETSGDGPTNGAYTGSLLSVWSGARASGRRLSLRSWYGYTKDLMSTAFPDQHPQITPLGAGAGILDVEL